MRSHRFYTPIELSINSSLELPKDAAHHCIQVLRYPIGKELVLFNGDGFDYLAIISKIEGKNCQVKISDKISPLNESPLNIHLFQGIAKGEKMDLIIQKAVELGVKQITPLFSERCNVKLDEKRLNKKMAHWQAVASSACEQSERAFIPQVNVAVQLKNLKINNMYTQGFYLEPTATQTIKELPSLTEIALFIGPEGGFSELDIQQLEVLNIQGLKLGPRILRTETAGLACIAIFQALYGDL
jgi:16S rRNA (uracil1498-N3)-methyltransferase